RRLLNYRHVAYSRHSHVERSRDGRCRKGEYVNRRILLFEVLLVCHTEALFLIYYKQSEVFKLYIVLNKPVRAYNKVYFSACKLFYYLMLLLLVSEPGQQLNFNWELF